MEENVEVTVEETENETSTGFKIAKFAFAFVGSAIAGRLIEKGIDRFIDGRKTKTTAEETE